MGFCVRKLGLGLEMGFRVRKMRFGVRKWGLGLEKWLEICR